MSLDYPLYEEMVRRKSRGRWYWRIGDWLYYIGLLTLCGSPALYVLAKAGGAVWPGRPDLGPAAGAAGLLGILVFLLGSFLKSVSYSIAEKEGIDVRKY